MKADNFSVLSTYVNGIKFRNFLILASGTFGKGYELSGVVNPELIGGIVSKTVTLNQKYGNSPPRIRETDCGLLNSIGLENPGVKGFLNDVYPKLENLPTEVILSVGGDKISDYVDVVSELNKTNARVFEINVSCPNVDKGGIEFGQDKKILAELIRAIKDSTDRVIWVKLPPDIMHILDLIETSIKYGADGVVLCNTYPASFVDIKNERFYFEKKQAGLSGPAVFPITLNIVRKSAEIFSDITIVASGGVSSFEHIIQYLMVGASLIEVGTMNLIDTPAVFKMPEQVAEYMQVNGKNLQQVRGMLIGR